MLSLSFLLKQKQNVHPISDKTGFRGPFMIEKIPLAIGNYRFLPFKCVFGELQCIRPKVLAILVLISHSTTVLSLSFSREKKKNVHPIRASLHIFLRLFCKDFAHFCNAFFSASSTSQFFSSFSFCQDLQYKKNLFSLGCSSLKY